MTATAPEQTTYSLTFEERPWSLNVERQGGKGRFFRQKFTKLWRRKFAELAVEHHLPALDHVAVVATVEIPNRSGEPDTGACIGAVKAAIDGLVDAGVLPHDGPAVVRSLHFLAPKVTGRNALTLVIAPALREGL